MKPRLLFPVLAVAAMFAASNYPTEIAAWHADREAKLKAEDGWLSLAGLFWLHEGSNPFGKDPSAEIVLPDGEILWTGNKCVKDVAGYSVKDLFVGSEGTLGIVTEKLGVSSPFVKPPIWKRENEQWLSQVVHSASAAAIFMGW